MSVLLVALALATADPAVAGPTTPPVQADDPPFPTGAPRDDYGLVAWCYGALRGYLELHDQAMPEVKRIESTWRRPGSNLADDLAVYATLQREGQRQVKVFARAMEAAEKASIRPINPRRRSLAEGPLHLGGGGQHAQGPAGAGVDELGAAGPLRAHRHFAGEERQADGGDVPGERPRSAVGGDGDARPPGPGDDPLRRRFRTCARRPGRPPRPGWRG